MPVYCFSCEKSYATQSTLNRHKREVHDMMDESLVIRYDQDITPFKCLEGCNISFKYNNELRNHLETLHKFENIVSEMDFSSFKEFEMWLEAEEREKNIRFCRSRGVKRFQKSNLERTYFDCSRSGTEKHHGLKRSEKSQGSAKLNRFCTSQIIVTRNTENEKCSIQYFVSHYGHDQEIQHINLSKGCRKEVAAKLMMGVSPTRIMDSALDSITGSLKRDDLITRKDINNIITSFNINSKDGCKHKEDAKEMKHYSQAGPSNNIKTEIKSSVLQLLANVDKLHYSKAEEKFILKNLKVLSSLGSVERKELNNMQLKNSRINTGEDVWLSNCPSNKKISKQLFLSTKKKRQ